MEREIAGAYIYDKTKFGGILLYIIGLNLGIFTKLLLAVPRGGGMNEQFRVLTRNCSFIPGAEE